MMRQGRRRFVLYTVSLMYILRDVPVLTELYPLTGSPMSVVSSSGHGSPMSWRTSIGSAETRFGSPMAICRSAPSNEQNTMLVDADKAHHIPYVTH